MVGPRRSAHLLACNTMASSATPLEMLLRSGELMEALASCNRIRSDRLASAEPGFRLAP